MPGIAPNEAGSKNNLSLKSNLSFIDILPSKFRDLIFTPDLDSSSKFSILIFSTFPPKISLIKTIFSLKEKE